MERKTQGPKPSFNKRGKNRGKVQRQNGFRAASDTSVIAPYKGGTARQSTAWYQPVFQQAKRVTLRYVENALSVVGTSGAVGGYVISANGVYDPNITGTGHQPMGFDQMMLLFTQCTVLGSKASFTVFNNSAASISAGAFLYLSPDTTVLSSFTRSVESGTCKYQILAPIGVIGNFAMDMSMSVDVARYFGRKPKSSILNDTELTSTSAANPIEQVYYILAAADIISAVNTNTLYFTVNVEYDCVFWEPRKLTQS